MKLGRQVAAGPRALQAMAASWNLILKATGNHWRVFKEAGVRDDFTLTDKH